MREQDIPGIHHARHGSRQQRIVDRDLAALVGLVPFDGGEFGCGPLGIEREHLLLPGVVDEQGGVAAHAVEVGQHDAQHGLAGDNGVEGISAGLEHVFRRESGPRRHGSHGILGAASQLLHGLGLCAERRHGNQGKRYGYSANHIAPRRRLVSQNRRGGAKRALRSDYSCNVLRPTCILVSTGGGW